MKSLEKRLNFFIYFVHFSLICISLFRMLIVGLYFVMNDMK